MTVLVVEDNEDNQRLVTKRLKASGHGVVVARGAAEAWVALDGGIPDLVLLDLQLPDGDGLDLARVMRADPRLDGVALVACTAYAFASDKERALEAGCDAWISKPVDIRSLVGELEAALAQRRGRP